MGQNLPVDVAQPKGRQQKKCTNNIDDRHNWEKEFLVQVITNADVSLFLYGYI
jgi:hypothetical protein